jgi:hypothetical protein
MNHKVMMMLGCVIAAAAFCAPAAAQKMYRCGSTYQETPCTGNQQGKEINAVGPASAQSVGGTDAACAQRGVASQKIVWAREAGATAEKALADVENKSLSRGQKEEEKRLIADIYQKRGSAPEIRAAIEADCLADKKLQSEAAALEQAAARLRGQAQPMAASGRVEESEAEQAAAAHQRDDEMASEARRKKALCDRLNARSEEILRSQRQGRSAQEFERLRAQRERVQSEARDAGC